jgi:hypothetical protein
VQYQKFASSIFRIIKFYNKIIYEFSAKRRLYSSIFSVPLKFSKTKKRQPLPGFITREIFNRQKQLKKLSKMLLTPTLNKVRNIQQKKKPTIFYQLKTFRYFSIWFQKTYISSFFYPINFVTNFFKFDLHYNPVSPFFIYISFFKTYWHFSTKNFVKHFFWYFNFFGIFNNAPLKSIQINYFKLFLQTKTIVDFSLFFKTFKNKYEFFFNDIFFHVFSNPYLFNFFFPIFSNVFLETTLQNSINYSITHYDEDAYEDDVEDDIEFEEEDPSDSNSPDPTFAKPYDKIKVRRIKIQNSLDDTDREEEIRTSFQYNEFNELNDFGAHSPDIPAHLPRSFFGYLSDSDIHELFYQYYFSRFYSPYNIEVFFYTFVFPYAFKNFNLQFNSSKFFTFIFLKFPNKLYFKNLSIFSVLQIFNFFSLYFKNFNSFYVFKETSFYNITKFKNRSFFIVKLFFKYKLIFFFKNFFYGYFTYLKTVHTKRELDFFNTYSRLYDLHQSEPEDIVGTTNDAIYGILTTEDEDEDPDYDNIFFSERLPDESAFWDEEDTLLDDISPEFSFDNYVYSDDFIEPFLTDDELNKAIEHSMSLDDSYISPSEISFSEQIEFETNELSLDQLLLQNFYFRFTENLSKTIFYKSSPFIADPILDLDQFELENPHDEANDTNDQSPAIDSSAGTSDEDDDFLRLPNNKKSVILLKNFSELYKDANLKWLSQNNSFNLKPLPPFLYGIGRYLPNQKSRTFLNFSDFRIFLNSKPQNFSIFPFFITKSVNEVLNSSSSIKDVSFLRNFFLLFQSPVHLYPNDSYLSTVIVFNLMSKNFDFIHQNFLPPEQKIDNLIKFLSGIFSQLIFFSDIHAVALSQTSNIYIPDSEEEVEFFLKLRKFRPTMFRYLKSRYFAILKNDVSRFSKGDLEFTTGDTNTDENFDPHDYYLQWNFAPVVNEETNYTIVFDEFFRINPRKFAQVSPIIKKRFFKFLNRYKINDKTYPLTKRAKKIRKSPNLRYYHPWRPFYRLKEVRKDEYIFSPNRISFRNFSKWFKFFKLDLTSIYPTHEFRKPSSFLQLIPFVNYSIFFAFEYLQTEFFFIYSLIQSSIPKSYKITPRIYQNFKSRPSSKNNYFFFETYYSNYLFYYPIKKRFIKRFRQRKQFLNMFSFDFFKYYRFKKQKQLKEKHLKRRKKKKKYPKFSSVAGTKNIHEPSYYTDFQGFYTKRPYKTTRIKLDDQNFDPTHFEKNDPSQRLTFFSISDTDFFYTKDENPLHAFFFNSNTFSFYKLFDYYFQPYQYVFPIGNYFFDSNFYPEEETNSDFNIFDFYIIDSEDQLLETAEDPTDEEDVYGDFDSGLETEDLSTDIKEPYGYAVSDASSDIESSEIFLPDDEENDYASYDMHQAGFNFYPGLDEYEYGSDYYFGDGDDSENYEMSDSDFDENFLETYEENANGSLDLFYDDVYEDFNQEYDNSSLIDSAYSASNLDFEYDKTLIDPFITGYFNYYRINPKSSYPASTFIHYFPRPIKNKRHRRYQYLLKKRKAYKAIDKKLRKNTTIKPLPQLYFKNSKYYLRYKHFYTLLNGNKTMQLPTFPLYNSFETAFQVNYGDQDAKDFDLSEETEMDEDITDYVEDSLHYELDQDNDDLDPDFFDFSLYTSVPISRFFFGYSPSSVSPFVSSDPRFMLSDQTELTFVNSTSFSRPFRASSTAMTMSPNSIFSPDKFKSSFFLIFFKLFYSYFIRIFITARLFFFYSFYKQKPEHLFSTATSDFMFSHYISNLNLYNPGFFKNYYQYLESWNFNLLSVSLSSLRFDYFKNFFNPTYYSNKEHFANFESSKFAIENDSEYLHLDYFIETELYTNLLFNQKIERTFSDRIAIPVFFWNYDEYFLYLLNTFDDYEFDHDLDVDNNIYGFHNHPNINLESPDDSLDHTDVYEELFDNLKEIYVSKFEIFLDALGQTIFIYFFTFVSLIKSFNFKVKSFLFNFSFYKEINWLKLYLAFGPIVYLIRVLLAFFFFLTISIYAGFIFPYFIFYMFPFVSHFYFLLIFSLSLALAIFFAGFICFKNFRYFIKTLDTEETEMFFIVSIIFWVVNVYAGYESRLPDFLDAFSKYSPYEKYAVIPSYTETTKIIQTRYKREIPIRFEPAVSSATFRYTDDKYIRLKVLLPVYPTGNALRPASAIYGKPFATQASGIKAGQFLSNPFSKTKNFINRISDNLFNSSPSENFYRVSSRFSSSEYGDRIQFRRALPIGRPRRRLKVNRGLGAGSIFSHPLYQDDFFFFNYQNPFHKTLVLSFPNTIYNNDYVFYPHYKKQYPLFNRRIIFSYYRQFQFISSRRQANPKRAIPILNEPKFRRYITQFHSYRPKKNRFVPNYNRKFYFKNVYGRYHKLARRSAIRIYKKTFTRNKIHPRRRIYSPYRIKISKFKRFTEAYKSRRFFKLYPYSYELEETFFRRNVFQRQYSPFSNSISSRYTSSPFFRSNRQNYQSFNFPNLLPPSKTSFGSVNVRRSLPLLHNKISSVMSSNNSKISSDSISFSNSIFSRELEILRDQKFFSEKIFPYLFYQYSANRLGSISYSNRYSKAVKKRFRGRSTRRFKIFERFEFFPPHYKFNTFISKSFDKTYTFIFSNTYSNRTFFNLSTVISRPASNFKIKSSANLILSRIRQKNQFNLFNKLFKRRSRLRSKKLRRKFRSISEYDKFFGFKTYFLEPLHGSTSFDGPTKPPFLKFFDRISVSNEQFLQLVTKDFFVQKPFYKLLSKYSAPEASQGLWGENNTEHSKYSYYRKLPNSDIFYPVSAMNFSNLSISNFFKVENESKRLRDINLFRIAFLQFVNSRKQFISLYTQSQILPLYSTSNYLNPIFFSLTSYSAFYPNFHSSTSVPPTDPNTFRKFKYLNSQPFQNFKTASFLKIFNTPSIYIFNEDKLDFSTNFFNIKNTYNFGNRSFSKKQNRLKRFRYRLDFPKKFDFFTNKSFKIFKARYVFSNLQNLLRAKSKMDINRFSIKRLSRSQLFSKSYRHAIVQKRLSLLSRRKANPNYKFTDAEINFLRRTRRKAFRPLKNFSEYLIAERTLLTKSILSRKLPNLNFLQMCGFMRYIPASQPIFNKSLLNSYPYDLNTWFFEDLAPRQTLYPSHYYKNKHPPKFNDRLQPIPDSNDFDYKRLPRSFKKRRRRDPITKVRSIFKRRKVTFNRVKFGPRTTFFLSQYLNINQKR